METVGFHVLNMKGNYSKTNNSFLAEEQSENEPIVEGNL